MLQARALGCERGGRTLFSDLDLDLSAGQALQVLGSNGSGKTTLLKILMGLYQEFSGEVDWDLPGAPLYLGHRPGVSDRLTVEENLDWLCRLQDVTPADEVLDRALSDLGLHGYQDTLCRHLSAGQRKRVNLARFFVCANVCWVMDEPFASIDDKGFALLEGKMQQHLEEGGSVLLTSHQELNLPDIRKLDLSA